MPIEPLDFTRAQYGDPHGAPTPAHPGVSHCAFCSRGLQEQYFVIDRDRACTVCLQRARELWPADTRRRFLSSIATGALAAVMAGTLYFLLFRATGGSWMVFAGIGVGYVVGKAMRLGSHGLGGRRYQVMAVVLTYAAIVVPSALAILRNPGALPAWAYPLLLVSPVLAVFLGHASLAGLQLLFAFAGVRWAWQLMAGGHPRITGPFALENGPEQRETA